MTLWPVCTTIRITLWAKGARSSSVIRSQGGFCWYPSPSEEKKFGSSLHANRTRTNDATMKKKQAAEPISDEMRPHYDFDYSKSRPNRFASRPKLGRVKAVVLDPDVAEVFHSSDDVNAFLRSAIKTMPPRRAEKRNSNKRAS